MHKAWRRRRVLGHMGPSATRYQQFRGLLKASVGAGFEPFEVGSRIAVENAVGQLEVFSAIEHASKRPTPVFRLRSAP